MAYPIFEHSRSMGVFLGLIASEPSCSLVRFAKLKISDASCALCFQTWLDGMGMLRFIKKRPWARMVQTRVYLALQRP